MARHENTESSEEDPIRRRRSTQNDSNDEPIELEARNYEERSMSLPLVSTAPTNTTDASPPIMSSRPKVRFSEDADQSRAEETALQENGDSFKALQGRQGRSYVPNLSIDTGEAVARSLPGHGTPQSFSAAPSSPLSSNQGQPRYMVLGSPSSPPQVRKRDRAYSLRKSLFSKNVGQLSRDNGTIIELQAAGPSNQGQSTPETLVDEVPSKKASPSITVSPALRFEEDLELPARPPKSTSGLSSLPHYESWVKRRAASSPLRRLRSLYERARKTILRISEIPPSKDGRHILLDASRKKALTDERTGHPYVNNTIRSSRYTLWNFLPRQLYAQFSKLANFYFLCVSVLQMIPSLSTTGTYTTIVPLMFFVSISMLKEGYDDLRRYRLDKAENNNITTVLHAYKPTVSSSADERESTPGAPAAHHWAETKWKDVQVGDIVKLKRDEAAPADLAILHAEGPNSTAYIETMAFDGETNLKSKQPSAELAKRCMDVEGIASCQAELVVEDPNLDLYNFDGKITVDDQTLPLSNVEVIYRGSILRNTPEAVGVVLYTGEECKIRMNATKNPRIKAPALQSVVNKVVVIIVIFVIVLAVFNTVAYQIWQETTEENSWYLTNASVSFVPILASFIILFNTMIPLSLYVSLEIVKVFQMMLMNDIDMYDADSNTPMEARTSTINEELGQVSYIFSDKTGTLTNNSMRFRKMSICGTAWLHDLDVQQELTGHTARKSIVQKKPSKGKKPSWRRSSTPDRRKVQKGARAMSAEQGQNRSPSFRQDTAASIWKPSTKAASGDDRRTVELLQYIQRRPHTPFAHQVRFFLLSIALCHTCMPEVSADGKIDFQAASPDELALVRAAQELGYILCDRQAETVTLTIESTNPDHEPLHETYQILDVIEFSSKRKRMSIIVKMPDNRICIFCKGADSMIIQLLRLSRLAMDKATEIERKVDQRKSLEAQEAIRRKSEHFARKGSLARSSFSIGRPGASAIARTSISIKTPELKQDEPNAWLNDRGADVVLSPQEIGSHSLTPRSSTHLQRHSSTLRSDSLQESQFQEKREWNEENLSMSSAAVFERTFEQINDFATEGLRTLLYGYRYLDENEYLGWKRLYLKATTSLVSRQEMIEKAGELIERDLELAGATAIEDKLQAGVPSTIDKLRRANIKLWMLTGDKRETAITVGYSCRLIKDYSTLTILDHESGEVHQRIASTILSINRNQVGHSVVVIDGQTLSIVEADHTLFKLFVNLAILADSVICCRASPSQKASLVGSIRRKVKSAITLAIGDGANDIAMIQEAHVGIGITGKEGLQAARTSDYSIAQFRFLLKLLLVHGRWNYVRTCKYTLGTFWKEMLFYLTQALFQRYAGYTGTSLYESWSLSMFNTLFTSLPVIFMGIFEKDLCAETLLAVPELYTLGQRNGAFSIKIYLAWVFMASSEAMVVFFVMLGLFGQAAFTNDNSLFAMGALTFTACVLVIATKMQFIELHNKSITCVVALLLSIGGWTLWNIILSALYTNNVIYDVKDGLLERWGRNALWWLTLLVILVSVWAFEVAVKAAWVSIKQSDVDVFRELEKDETCWKRFQDGAREEMGKEAADGDEEMRAKGQVLGNLRTEEEQEKREGEVQELLDRPRMMLDDGDRLGANGVRRRHSSTDGQDGEQQVEQAKDEEEEKEHGIRRRSTDVHELLRKGFGSIRRSLDVR